MSSRGQVLVGVVAIMIVMLILIPTMVMYVQNEAKWSTKNAQNTSAFQLAEAGLDRAFRKVSESTTTWNNIQNRVFPAGYTFDQAYYDLGGSYAIMVSSGPEAQQVEILVVGRDALRKETRAIKAVFNNSPIGDTAIRAQSSVSIGGANTAVHWGAIVTPAAITANGRLFPQFWSASTIDLDGNGSTPPNCDQPGCVQWHSFSADIPPNPNIDLGWYASSATANTGCPSGGTPAGSCYYSGDQCWGSNGCPGNNNCDNSTECATDKTYYINGNLEVRSSGIYVRGTLIVTGNLSLPNGTSGAGPNNLPVPLPRQAWMQYGRSWATYSTAWDPSKPASFPGLNSNYKSAAGLTVPIDNVMVNGFIYVGGNVTQTGGSGNTRVVGSIFVGGSVTVDPNNFYVYYTESAGQNIKSTQVILSRDSWRDWPAQGWPGL